VLATVDDVRTLMVAHDEEFAKILENMKRIRQAFEAGAGAA
jgi:hypothetical protein